MAAERTQQSAQLWLQYASLLDKALQVQKPGLDPAKEAYVAVNEEELDSLEGDYADCSAYWELRYFNARAAHRGEELPALDWLRRGREHGALDFHGLWFLYWGELRLVDDSLESRLKLARELTALLPGESWTHYNAAFIECEAGNWDAGIAALEVGNTASQNRAPNLFPWSEVATADEAHISQGPAVGTTYSVYTAINKLPNYVRRKNQFKAQVKRWQGGAPLTEFAPWFTYICRIGSAPGNEDSLDQIVALAYFYVFSNYLLAEGSPRLSPEQRLAQLRLRDRMTKIKQKFMRELPDLGMESYLTSLVSADHGMAWWYYKQVEQNYAIGSACSEEFAQLPGYFDPVNFALIKQEQPEETPTSP